MLHGSPTPVAETETEIHRLLDRAVGRALVDPLYAARLLERPTIALEGGGCTPRQYLVLKSIRASTLQELACQALALLWPSTSTAEYAVSPARAAGTG